MQCYTLVLQSFSSRVTVSMALCYVLETELPSLPVAVYHQHLWDTWQ